MKAAICTKYGPPDNVTLSEVPTPVPASREILVRIHATTVSSGDCRMRGANFPPGFAPVARLALGWSGPRQPILGTECAGTVVAVGPQVSRYRAGDEVFAFTGARFGCHAEYIALPEDGAIAAKPASLSFEEAAALCFGGTTALHFLRDRARVARGERVLVNGAGGSVGIAAVQIARHLGAHVTAVCSLGKANRVASLGAQATIDYGTTDFAVLGERWDVIVDTVGNVTPPRVRSAVNKRGRLLLLAAGLPDLIAAPFHSARSRLAVIAGVAPGRREDVLTMKALFDAGAYKPVIDSRFAFDDMVDAHRRVEAGGKTGSVAVIVAG